MMEPRLIVDGNCPWPSVCARCGAPEKVMLDLGVDMPDPQPMLKTMAVLICASCFDNLAEVMSYAPVEKRPEEEVFNSELLEKSRVAVDELSNFLHSDFTYLRIVDTEENGEEAETDGRNSVNGQSNDTFVQQKSNGISSDSIDELLSEIK